MRVVENAILPLFGFKAITIFKWIFVHKGVELSKQDINHEAIHWEQEKELLIVGFYLLYVLMFLWELARCMFDGKRGATDRSWQNGLLKRAYRSIAFEREAYQHEADTLYIYQRKHYAWLMKG